MVGGGGGGDRDADVENTTLYCQPQEHSQCNKSPNSSQRRQRVNSAVCAWSMRQTVCTCSFCILAAVKNWDQTQQKMRDANTLARIKASRRQLAHVLKRVCMIPHRGSVAESGFSYITEAATNQNTCPGPL